MVHHQHFLNQYFAVVFLLRPLLEPLQVPFDFVDFLLDVGAGSGKLLDELEEILWSQDAVVYVIEEREHPEVDEFEVAVGCILNEVAELPEAEGLGEAEEVEESLQQFSVDGVLVFVDDALSRDLELVHYLIAACCSSPPLKSLSQLLLIHLQLLMVEDRPPQVQRFLLLVLLLQQGGQLLRIVPLPWPFAFKLLVVPIQAALTHIESIVVAERGLSRGEIVPLSLPAATEMRPICWSEVGSMNEIDIVDALQGEFVLILEEIAK